VAQRAFKRKRGTFGKERSYAAVNRQPRQHQRPHPHQELLVLREAGPRDHGRIWALGLTPGLPAAVPAMGLRFERCIAAPWRNGTLALRCDCLPPRLAKAIITGVETGGLKRTKNVVEGWHSCQPFFVFKLERRDSPTRYC